MRFLKSAILCFVVLSSVCVQAGAVGKITVDPNKQGAKVSAITLETDARLAQRVTYEAKRKTVHAILNDLSEMTGVTLCAGYNNLDWQVRDRKMNVFAKDVPLADLMNSIARVMKFKWSINHDVEPWTYRLFMDRKTLLDAEAQKARSDARIKEKLAQRRKELLDDIENASSGVAGSLRELCTEVPVLTEAVATGQELALSASQLSSAGKDVVLNTLPDGFPRDIENITILVNGLSDPTKLAQIIFTSGDQACGFSCGGFDMSDDNADIYGMLKPDIDELNRELDDPNKTSDEKSEISNRYAEALLTLDKAGSAPGEPFTQHPDDPALAKKIKLQSKSTLLADVQCALAESSGFAVVSDYFGKVETYGGVNNCNDDIKTLLDKITKPCLYNWDKHGSVIEFRDRYWFSKRSAQIPESWIEAWRQALKKNGTLDISKLAQIAELTLEQFNMNIRDDEILSSTSGPYSLSVSSLITFNQNVLRAYGALTDGQRNALFSTSGLDISELSPDQLAIVEKPISRANPKYLLNPDARITMTANSVQKGKQLDYTLTATTNDSLDQIVWKFTTPKYEPPKSKQPKETDPKSGTK